MDWQHATVAEIDGQIDRLRDDETANRCLLAEAETAQRHADAAHDAAVAVQQQCRERIDFDTAERKRLETERSALPGQRTPA